MSGTKEIIRYPELKSRYGIDFTFDHICRLSKAGKFPPKLKLSYRSVAWRVADVEDWLDKCQVDGGAK